MFYHKDRGIKYYLLIYTYIPWTKSSNIRDPATIQFAASVLLAGIGHDLLLWEQEEIYNLR